MEALNFELILCLGFIALAAGMYTLVRIGMKVWQLLFGPKNRPHPEEEQPKKQALETHPWTEPE